MARKPRQKPKRTPSLAQRRADPGLRSRLPMSQLTPAQQASRRRNQQVAADNKNPLYDPTTQLAGHSLVAAAAQLADEQIKPKVDAYNRQITSATTQGTALASRAGDYYKQLAQQAMGTVASQKALSDMLNAQTAQVGQQSQAAFAGMGQAPVSAATRAPGSRPSSRISRAPPRHCSRAPRTRRRRPGRAGRASRTR
jgi:hypothetical protein